jgi:P-type Cu+ transporter
MRAAGPVADPVACSGCGKLLDPLRAGHVAIFDQRFHYFCDAGLCRAAFLKLPAGSEDTPRTAPASAFRPAGGPAIRPADARPVETAKKAPELDAFLPALPTLGDDRSMIEPIARTILAEPPARLEVPEPRDMGALLLVIAVIAGSLAVALSLAGDSTLILAARAMLAAVSAGMLIGRGATTERDASDPHPIPLLAAPLASVLLCAWAAVAESPEVGDEAASLAGVICTAAAISAWLVESARRFVQAERHWIASALDVPGRIAPESGTGDAHPDKRFDLRPGEVVVVETGEDVPVDLSVSGGEVEVLPWIGATTRARRRDGDAVVAGARVVRGRLRGVCTYAGYDRAFARVLLDPRRRADALAPAARGPRSLAERWAFAPAAISALSSFALGHDALEVAMVAVSVHAGLATAVIGSLSAVHVARGILLGLRRGITYRSADAWDRAGRVGVAMFNARGTLLLGEPELAEIEATSPKLDEDDILSLAAGAERSERHPIATAIVRAAKVRGVRPEGVRNQSSMAGLGVSAIAPNGEELCVGSRTFMVDQRISVAAAEQRIGELESNGRTVVLVALGGRLAGWLALQDGLRPGARAAVQHLLDAQVEPVLMSGDARDTCEAIGRSLDIDHIRPEILPQDRAAEVKRLIEAGMSVAALGHAGIDDDALGAADVAVALGAAGSSQGEYEVALASDDVRDAALSLALARRTRTEARVGFALAAVPAAIGAIAVSLGLLLPAYVPIASLLGGIMGVLHGRALDRLRTAASTSSEESIPLT